MLPDSGAVRAIRDGMRAPLELYYLCSGPAGGGARAPHVRALTALLRRSAEAGAGGAAALAEYQAAARWSTLGRAGWPSPGRVCH